MNECLTTPQHGSHIGYWVSDNGMFTSCQYLVPCGSRVTCVVAGRVSIVCYQDNLCPSHLHTICSKICFNHKLCKLKSNKELNWKEEGRSVLFNDALNTFYLRLYGVGHMAKDHSDSERGNPLPPHGLLFPISSKGSFISSHRQDKTYHGLCYTSRRALAGTRNSSMGPPHEGSIRRPISP